MHFNFKERVATLVLILGIGLATFYYWYAGGKKAVAVISHTDTSVKAQWLQMLTKNTTDNNEDDEETNQHFWAPKSVSDLYNKAPEYFMFNPNTITLQDWEKLGVKTYIAKSILKYIEKGGKFYKPDDLNKIFFFTKADVDKLLPYVQIEKAAFKTNNYKTFGKRDTTNTYKPTWVNTPKTPVIVDVNYGDTSAFRALPLIGSYLAKNIVKYREKLGGFVTINQIAEVYGISQVTFDSIKPMLRISDMPITKIDINNITLENLIKHPYITDKNLAKVIIAYRKQHGDKFNAVEDLKKIMIVEDVFYNKIAPYIEIK